MLNSASMTKPSARPPLTPVLATILAVTAFGCSGGKGAAAPKDAQAGQDAAAAEPDSSAVSPTDSASTASKDVVPSDVGIAAGYDAMATIDAPNARPPAYVEQIPNGKISYDFLGKGYGEWICAVLPQANGQVILVGTTNTTWVSGMDTWAENAFTLVRLNPDGELDTTFGTAGKIQVTPTTHTVNACRAAAQTKDGKILVAGDAIAHTSGAEVRNEDFVLARLNQDGALDLEFGDSGFATANFHPTADDPGRKDTLDSLALLDDGRILLSGSMTVKEAPAFSYPALARFTPDGVLDPSFGTAGLLTFNPASLPGATAELQRNASLTSTASAIVVEPDGATVVGLSVQGNITGYDFALFRLEPDGTPDTGFADGGSRWESAGSPQDIFELAQLSRNADGTLLVLARGYRSFRLYRTTAEGRPDPSFGTTGSLRRATTTSGTQRALFILRPADGSVLLGLGESSGNYGAFGLLRILADGTFDDPFGEPIWTWDNDPTQVPHITAGALFPNGDIVVAGDITTKNNTDTVAFRLKKNTSP